MTSMKIVQFSRPSIPLVQLHPKSFDPLDLGYPISNTPPPPPPPSPNFNQLKENNPRMAIISYQVFPSGWLSFLVSTYYSCVAFH